MNKGSSFLLIITLLSSCIMVKANGTVGGYGGVTLSAWTDDPPTIDGIMGPGEWVNADSYDFTTDHVPTPVDGTLYVMNDAENLYIFVKIYRDDDAILTIKFDNDNDRIEWEEDDDGISYNWDNLDSFFDLHYSAWGSDPTTQDGQGAHTGGASHEYAEFSHPLNSGDPYDFALSIGDTVGFQICFDAEFAGIGYWPPQANTTNDILIAGPPEPVGGELLGSSTPYILLILLGSIILLSGIQTKKHLTALHN